MSSTPSPHLARRLLLRLSLAGVAALASCANSASPHRKSMTMTHDPRHDFDFLFGTWHVRHRRLKERLAGSTEWETFDGTCRSLPLMDGLGNVDDNLVNLPQGPYRAVGLRSFDPATRRWAIWWLDGRNPHAIDVPVVGGFDGGVGRFLAEDTLRGQPIVVRFEWSRITARTARWEQAFSPDGGKTWEVNWEMDFERT